MKKIICLLATFLLSAPAMAETFFEIEAGVSSTNYGTQGDGTWYQQGLPHVLNLHTYGFSFGLTGNLYSHGDVGIDWHVDYVNLGHLSSSCDCTPIDSNYNTHSHTLVSDPIPVPNAKFLGNGNAQGIAFTLEPYYKYRGWKISAEGGLFPYRPSWDETIYNWQVDPQVAPQTIHANTPHGLQLGYVVGVGVGRGNAALALKHYWLPTRFDNNHYPAIYKGATVVEFKYKF